MKILQINAVNGIVSTGRTSMEMAEYLNKNGHEAFIAHARGPEYKKGFRVGNVFDHKAHALLSRLTGLQGYFSRGATQQLLRCMSGLKPDVVHLRDLHSNFINLELLFTYLAEKDIPTVLTLHDCWFFTGKCCFYSSQGCFKWQDSCGPCPGLGSDNPSWFLDRTEKMHQDKKRWLGKIPRLAVVGVSDWIKNEAGKSFLSSAKILTRIFNWIDTDIFRPAVPDKKKMPPGLEKKFIILGTAVRWGKRKGLSKFIELSGAIPEDAAIVLVGGIPPGTRLPENMVNIKKTDDAGELAGYYSLADVFLHFSKEECCCKSVQEALSCGTPAIVMNSTGNPELVNKNTGIVLDTDETANVLSAVSEIRDKGKDYYSAACVSFAGESFNKADRIGDYLEVYRRITERD